MADVPVPHGEALESLEGAIVGRFAVHLGDVQTGKPAQDVGEIFLWINPAAPTADDKGVDHRTAPTGVRMPHEEPAALFTRPLR